MNAIRIEIGRRVLNPQQIRTLREFILVDPPPGLRLGEALADSVQTLYIADFGTHGLGGPTRADDDGEPRDFVDFLRNIGQPPDKEFGGGSFGYGKAAFYIASRAQTIVVDTLCDTGSGELERRLLACGLGNTFDLDGRPYTGRHWWGRISNGIPEPLLGDEAAWVARQLGLPEREGPDSMGTTVVVVAPAVTVQSSDGADATMAFIAEALAWNFWPRMIDTPGGARRSMDFRVIDDGVPVRVPNPRSHPRLRGFVEAMDVMRREPGDEDDLVMDRPIKALRPARTLGRLTIQKGPVAPADLPERPVPQGARITAASVHHIALMRTPELVVRYLPGATPVIGKIGYSGVFKCALDVDDMFKAAEPPTHDDWIYRFVHEPRWRSFVKIALERIQTHCRSAAGYDTALKSIHEADGIPLGEFADALAALMPGHEGPGARRPSAGPRNQPKRRRRRTPGSRDIDSVAGETWVDGAGSASAASQEAGDGSQVAIAENVPRPQQPPQTRPGGDPSPAIAADGTPVVRYPFELRTRGNRVRLSATVEILTNDGGQVETEAPAGYVAPSLQAWIDPAGGRHSTTEVITGPEGVDGLWSVEVELREEMMQLNIEVEVA
ncbi:hypothetical protein [Mycolicibacterium sp. 120270]|uniref:hypothetical protein n=1 Tax=Mycolicibacterium sp. 120270 TaxID=3090600 RepID=UPI00299E6D58|nr:hypothetical protein [Mycolicibacterium sp. 120270]MDX1883238.1 hypothetical protein [Mycolicibacterium sp. 120270]